MSSEYEHIMVRANNAVRCGRTEDLRLLGTAVPSGEKRLLKPKGCFCAFPIIHTETIRDRRHNTFVELVEASRVNQLVRLDRTP